MGGCEGGNPGRKDVGEEVEGVSIGSGLEIVRALELKGMIR